MSADPVAWIMIEDGWKVVGRDGVELGRIGAIFGDENADIFDGLLVEGGLARKGHYIAAEHVSGIYEGLVEVDLDVGGVEALEGEAPGSVKALVRERF